MADRELEQALVAAFEAVLGNSHGSGLAQIDAGVERDAQAIAEQLETLTTEIQRTTAEPSRSISNATTAEAGAATDGAGVSRSMTTVGLPTPSNLGTTNWPAIEGPDTKAGQGIVSTVLKTGLGAVPLVRLVAGLFGGGGAEAPPSLVKYAPPAPIHIERANADPTDGRIWFAEFDHSQAGERRMFENANVSLMDSPTKSGSKQYADEHVNAGTPQITVNVQAMDSRSFLDHSDEIARAVREAMLNMHALNDVVSDL